MQGANLINYFGKTNDIKDIEIAPILMRKGVTKLALYGLGEPPRSVPLTPSTPNRQDKPASWPAGCFLALGADLRFVATASARR